MLVQAVRVELAEEAGRGSAPEYIATVRANEETDFGFKIGGIIELVGPRPDHGWDEGTPVEAHAVLAQLKQADFVNAFNSAQARADLTHKNFDRFSKLRAADAISQQEFDAAKADAETAKAQLAQAQQNLDDSVLRAPWDGVVLARYVNFGETVSAGKPVVRFADTSIMSVELGVPDRLLSYFTVGKEIDVEISALEGRPPFAGRVSEVGVAASKEGRLFRVVIKVRNQTGLIRSGMTATVRVGNLIGAPAASVLVPLSALVATPAAGTGAEAKEAQLAVFVVLEGKATLRRVKTGDIIKSSIIVSQGLKEGEEVVSGGASLLYDGAPVQVVAAAAVGN